MLFFFIHFHTLFSRFLGYVLRSEMMFKDQIYGAFTTSDSTREITRPKSTHSFLIFMILCSLHISDSYNRQRGMYVTFQPNYKDSYSMLLFLIHVPRMCRTNITKKKDDQDTLGRIQNETQNKRTRNRHSIRTKLKPFETKASHTITPNTSTPKEPPCQSPSNLIIL